MRQNNIKEPLYILKIEKQLNKINNLMCNPTNFDKSKVLQSGNQFFKLSCEFYNYLDQICNE